MPHLLGNPLVRNHTQWYVVGRYIFKIRGILSTIIIAVGIFVTVLLHVSMDVLTLQNKKYTLNHRTP